MMPCVEEKCILLPVCKSKRVIRCFKVLDYINHQGYPAWEEQINKVLPNAKEVSLNPKSYILEETKY